MIKTFGKRIAAMVVASAVVAGVTVTYGIPNIKYKEIKSSEPVVMTVNGDEIHMDEFRAYLKYNKSYMENMLSYYGMDDTIWSDPTMGEMMVGQLFESANQQAIEIHTVKQEFEKLGIDAVEQCLPVFASMVDTLTVLKKNMQRAASGGFINATDCADYLVKKGMPFREAYMIVGRLVHMCLRSGETLDTLPLKDFQSISSIFGPDVYQALELKTCVGGRKVYGGPAPEAVQVQIDNIQAFIDAREKGAEEQ